MIKVCLVEQSGGWITFDATDMDDAFHGLMEFDFVAASINDDIVYGSIENDVKTFYIGENQWFGEETIVYLPE